MIDFGGNWSDKEQELDYISKNKPSYDSFRFEIKRLDLFENGTAVVSGTGHVEGSDGKGPYKMQYQSSNILIKRNGQWKAISSHVSGVKYEQ
jgi:ketosteroid isomerase-like protein